MLLPSFLSTSDVWGWLSLLLAFPLLGNMQALTVRDGWDARFDQDGGNMFTTGLEGSQWNMAQLWGHAIGKNNESYKTMLEAAFPSLFEQRGSGISLGAEFGLDGLFNGNGGGGASGMSKGKWAKLMLALAQAGQGFGGGEDPGLGPVNIDDPGSQVHTIPTADPPRRRSGGRRGGGGAGMNRGDVFANYLRQFQQGYDRTLANDPLGGSLLDIVRRESRPEDDRPIFLQNNIKASPMTAP